MPRADGIEHKKIVRTLDAMIADMREIVELLQREKRARASMDIAAQPSAFDGLRALVAQLRAERLVPGGVQIAANWPSMIPRLTCAECGRTDPQGDPGWTMRLDVDDELVVFCPECDEREFGDA